MRKGITPTLPIGINEWINMCENEVEDVFDTIALCNSGGMWASKSSGHEHAYFRATA